ncbi:MAG TPA: hypothetical protein VKP65_02910 [Rhodothermales bacterium]|nr:hypothetical protein [Rhodothermales bacterium]
MSDTYEDWIVVFKSGTDYEADLVRDRLDDADIPAVVLTQRDHAFNLTMGDLAQVHVLVPPAHVEAAVAVLDSIPFTDEELTEAALAAKPSPDAHNEEEEAMLDSGAEAIRLSVPEEDEDEEEEV